MLRSRKVIIYLKIGALLVQPETSSSCTKTYLVYIIIHTLLKASAIQMPPRGYDIQQACKSTSTSKMK